MKKVILGIFLAGLFFGCDTKDIKDLRNKMEDAQNRNSSIKQVDRIIFISSRDVNGYAATILIDTETGREFLSYNHGLIEIRPKADINVIGY